MRPNTKITNPIKAKTALMSILLLVLFKCTLFKAIAENLMSRLVN